MASKSPVTRQGEAGVATDPFAGAKEKLFSPLRNRTLSEAADALSDSRLAIAEPLVSKFLAKHPKDPDALNLMADIFRRSGRFEKAEQLLSRCLDQGRQCAGYRFNYAVILLRLDKFEQAIVQLDKLLIADPRNPLYRDQKAKVLHMMGRRADALEYRRELSEEYPTSPEVWLNYGDSLRGVGCRDDCIAAYRRALELAPSLSAAYLHLVDLKTYRFTGPEIERIETQLTLTGLSADDRANLHFVLGNAFGDQKLYAKSFDNYARANALRRLGADAVPDKLTEHRLNCQALFTERFFHDRTGWGSDSADPIFVVGLPRSGSTLIEQILSSHTAIEGLGELADLETIVGRLLSGVELQSPSQAYAQALNRLDAADFRSLGEGYLELACRRRKPGRPFFTDKGLTNFSQVGLIHLILPNAKIVDVRRHPLDCGWSCFKSHFPAGQPFSHRLSDIGRYYANYVRLTAHFERVLPGRIHRVIYEDLVANPEAEIRQMFEYLGLPFEEQCLRFHENKRAVATLSSEQVRMPLYTSGVGQWRPYEAWLGPLRTALGAVLDNYPDVPELTSLAAAESARA